MNSNYFSAARDRAIIEAGGFWCHACLVGKLASEQSPDPRYCQGCYEFLLKEAELLGRVKKPSWAPVAGYTGRHTGRGEALPAVKEVVTKIADKGIPPVGIMLQRRGRPKKAGKVTRMTEWRRKKVMQGALL